MRIGRRAFLGAALASASAAACSKTGVRPGNAVRRIVSISPSTTETIYAINGRDLIVGRSRYCDWPPEVTTLPQVGGYVDPSFEAILALRPDLVTGARGPAGDALTKKLGARGIATYFPPTESFAEIDAMILGMGDRINRAHDAHVVVESVIRPHVSHVEDAVKAAPRVKVLLVFGLEPLAVAGPTSFADEMVRRAGGVNVVTTGGGYPTISVEHVFALDPDVIVNAAIAESHGLERLNKDTPGWGKVRAVTEGRVAPVADESVLRPGPRIGDGLTSLARALHPGLEIP